MHRLKLCNNFLRHRSNESRKRYSKQRYCCVTLFRRIKKNYYNNLNENNLNIVINLNVPEYHDYEGISRNISHPTLKAIVIYRNHPSIKAIKRVSISNDLFSFDIVDRENSLKKISSLDHTKACKESDISTKIIKENADIFSEVLHLSLNAWVNEGTFASVFKLADVTPIFKKGSKNSKDNYRPISMLKNLSKVFENITYKQMATFMDKYFSKFQCGFRKGYSTQKYLIVLIAKW